MKSRTALLAAGAALAASWPVQSRATVSVWKPVATLPVGIAGFARGVLDGKIVVAGGTTWDQAAKIVLQRAWSYDPGVDRWTELDPLPRPFAFGGFGVLGQQLVLLGGDDGKSTRSDGMAVPCARDDSDGLVLPEPAAYVGSAVGGRAVYLLGGTRDLRDLTRLTARFVCVAPGHPPENLPDFPGGPVMHTTMVSLGGMIFVFPGGTYDAARHAAANTRRAWRYHTTRRTWEEMASYPFAVRGLAACALDDRFILLAGGYRSRADDSSGALTAESFVYDTRTDRYAPAPSLPYAAMLVGLVRVGDHIYAFGGEDGDRHRARAVYRIALADLLSAVAP